jgi:iron(III) transport system substrate-binding protein
VALAYPQFGTTATHFHALRQLWGETLWETWCRSFAANKPLLVDGNSMVVKMVGTGEAVLGVSDSDDVAAAQADAMPVAAAPMMNETLSIPNTVALIRGAPHPENADRLFSFLHRPEIAQMLVAANALEGATLDQKGGSTLQVNWESLLAGLESTTAKLNQIFLR